MRRWRYYDIPSFIDELNRRCCRDDPLYPVLDFFNRSGSKIAAMQLKRYRNDRYREARAQSLHGRCEPRLAEIVSHMMACMQCHGLIKKSPIRLSCNQYGEDTLLSDEHSVV